MRRVSGLSVATVVQLALVAVAGGFLFIAAGFAQQHTAPPAPPTYTLHPATAEERRQWERDRLADALEKAHERGPASHPPAGIRYPTSLDSTSPPVETKPDGPA